MDVICAKCGEPWDMFDGGDMNYSERKRFYAGDGCPACEFGTICTHCRGTGREQEDSRLSSCYCRGDHYIFVRSAAWVPNTWSYDYSPNVRHIAPMPARIISQETQECSEGKYQSIKILCPFCGDTAPICPACNGTGKFTPASEGDYSEAFLSSALDAME